MSPSGAASGALAAVAALSFAGEPQHGHEWPDDPPAAVSEGERRVGPAARPSRGDFTSVQVNTDSGGQNIFNDAANEPSIAVHPGNRLRIAIGWRQFDNIQSNFRQAGLAFSTDGGRGWTNSGPLDPGIFRSDPVLECGADGTLYYDSLAVDDSFHTDVFVSNDSGATWSPPLPAFGGDKQWIDVDRTSGPGHGQIYQAWDYAGCCEENWFNRSPAGGAGFEFPVPIPDEPYWGVTEVGPDGTVYVIGRKTNPDDFAVARSSTVEDPLSPMAFDGAFPVDLGGALRFNIGVGPNPGGLLGQVWIAADHSFGPRRGHLYALASVDPPGDDPLDVHFVRSTDRGETWSAPLRLNIDSPGSGSYQWFGTLAVAGDGRIDVIWNDTRDDPAGRISELVYISSDDGGTTWSPRLVVSPVFDPHLGWPQQSKLGDYYDMVSDKVGAHVAYAATFNQEQDVYYLRIGDWDCNDNAVGDATDISSGASQDVDQDGIPDECRVDGDGDGAVDPLDNCPAIFNPEQLDANHDGVGDVCDDPIFLDGFESGSTNQWDDEMSPGEGAQRSRPSGD
jgi:hypothetical protein